jgi:hypothetical protein
MLQDERGREATPGTLPAFGNEFRDSFRDVLWFPLNDQVRPINLLNASVRPDAANLSKARRRDQFVSFSLDVKQRNSDLA